jgi:hypothetical protein
MYTANGQPLGLDHLAAADAAIEEHGGKAALPESDPRVQAFIACDAILSKSPLGSASQAAVAVMVLAAAAMRTNAEHPQVGRGKLINALTNDVRKALQREIPL